MQWTGSIFPDEDPVVLYGTIDVRGSLSTSIDSNVRPMKTLTIREEIYDAIISVNPDYAPPEVEGRDISIRGIQPGPTNA
jgi:hypothetical protein